jgi:hypothetical protein
MFDICEENCAEGFFRLGNKRDFDQGLVYFTVEGVGSGGDDNLELFQ